MRTPDTLALVVAVLATATACGPGESPVDPGAGHLVFDPSTTYAFGSVAVGTTATASLGVWNRTAQDCQLGELGGMRAPFAFAGGTFPGAGSTCGASLAAGARCDVVVAFAPTSPGDYTTYPLTLGSTTIVASYAAGVKCLGHAGTAQDPTPAATRGISGQGF